MLALPKVVIGVRGPAKNDVVVSYPTVDDRNTLFLVCCGESQWPIIPNASLVEFNPQSCLPIKPGDLVVYKNSERVICHRVLFIRRTERTVEYLVKGDANLTSDGWIPASAVIGKITAINGVSTSSLVHRFFSLALFAHSSLQFGLVRLLAKLHLVALCHRLGKPGRDLVRMVMGVVHNLTSPWLLFRQGTK